MSDKPVSSYCEYRLRCSIRGHSADVRAVASTHAGEIVTASRDNTARLWKPKDTTSTSLDFETEFEGHVNFVTSICVLSPSEKFPEGLVLTGSRDKSVLIFHPEMSKAIKKINNHLDNVSCLSANDSLFASGSWDSSVLVYRIDDINDDYIQPVQVLTGKHTGPIWSVLALPDGILTGGADSHIWLWKNGTAFKQFKGHSDCVRGMALLNCKKYFLSCSNDASIRQWDIVTGLCVSAYYGHTSFIYSIAVFGSGSSARFVTASEDYTLRVWGSEGIILQTINLPCETNWSVAILPNSDIAVGSSDGVCRVFTNSLDRVASEAEMVAFNDNVSNTKRKNLQGINTEKFSDKMVLHTPGTKDGQTVIVKEDGFVMCYRWSSSKMMWEKVGEVVGGSGGDNSTSGKVLHEGKEYDYVFNVEIDVGTKLKLPFNLDEDPFVAAQRFIHMHELPQDQLETVANFIITNSNWNSQQQPTDTGYFDPFTGGNRYVPGASSSTMGAASDPFTSSGRYVPPSSPMEVSYSTTCAYFPIREPLSFATFNAAGTRKKLEQHNQLETDPNFKLSNDELESLFSAVFDNETLREKIEPSKLASLEKAFSWKERKWPSFDLLRLCVRCSEVQNVWLIGTKGEQIMQLLWASATTKTNLPAEICMALRCLSNLAAHPVGADLLIESFRKSRNSEPIYDKILPTADNNIQIAAATLLLNVSVLLTKNGLDEDSPVLEPLLFNLLSFFNEKNLKAEGSYRALVALGTLLSNSKTDMPIKMAQLIGLDKVLSKLLSATGLPAKNIDCIRTINAILKTTA